MSSVVSVKRERLMCGNLSRMQDLNFFWSINSRKACWERTIMVDFQSFGFSLVNASSRPSISGPLRIAEQTPLDWQKSNWPLFCFT